MAESHPVDPARGLPARAVPTRPATEVDVDHDLHGQRRSHGRGGGEIDVPVLATAQDGIVSADELRERGVGRGARDHRLVSGRLFGVHRGVYLVGHEATTFRGRSIAGLRACGSDSTLSHLASAASWGAAAPPATLDVIVPPGRRRSRPGIRVHHVALTPAERALRDGVALTTPARTLIDLAAVVPAALLERICADMLVAKLLTRAQLAAAVEAGRGRRGIVALRELSGTVEPTRSDTERAFLRAVRDAGLPLPIVNAPFLVAGLGRIEPDFLWASPRVIVEMDAYGTHGGPPSFERDRQRDVALHALGWIVLRFTRRQVYRQARKVVTQVAQVLALRGLSISP
jgi:hypothetical protein